MVTLRLVFSQPAATPDPVEAARLQQLQAAAAQWQQVQQQRANMQYQVLMQHHEKLQQILEQYQQLIQQPFNPQVGRTFFSQQYFATMAQNCNNNSPSFYLFSFIAVDVC